MVAVLGFKRLTDRNRQENVTTSYLTPSARNWTEKEIEDEFRKNGAIYDVKTGGFGILEYIGFEMEVSPNLARGNFVISERACQENGELVGGVIEYIAESIASAAGVMSSTTHNVLGIELNVNHLQPAFVGQELKVIAKPLKQGKTVQVFEMIFEARDKTEDSTTESHVDQCQTILIAIARFTLVVQGPYTGKPSVVRSKL